MSVMPRRRRRSPFLGLAPRFFLAAACALLAACVNVPEEGRGKSAAGAGASAGAGPSAGAGASAGAGPSAGAGASADPSLELVFRGSGLIPSIRSPRSLALREDAKIRILLLPEGYLASDAERFRADVAAWIAELEAVEPFASFKEAFDVYAYFAPSARHVLPGADGGTDTAFRIRLDAAGQVLDDLGETRKRFWALVDRLGITGDVWYPAGGLTHRQNKGLVGAILILDPLLGRAGYSGLSRRFARPEDPEKIVAVGISENSAHEFLHAFARLDDEYIELDRRDRAMENARSQRAPNLSNVVRDPDRRSVPWGHLLPGAAFDPGIPFLIGCFGEERSGYHSEAACLLNGKHDNAGFYGGDGDLRSRDRLCAWCREIVVFRLLERVGVFSRPESDFQRWVAEYRAPFYRAWPVKAPPWPLPRRSSTGREIPALWY